MCSGSKLAVDLMQNKVYCFLRMRLRVSKRICIFMHLQLATRGFVDASRRWISTIV